MASLCLPLTSSSAHSLQGHLPNSPCQHPILPCGHPFHGPPLQKGTLLANPIPPFFILSMVEETMGHLHSYTFWDGAQGTGAEGMNVGVGIPHSDTRQTMTVNTRFAGRLLHAHRETPACSLRC